MVQKSIFLIKVQTIIYVFLMRESTVHQILGLIIHGHGGGAISKICGGGVLDLINFEKYAGSWPKFGNNIIFKGQFFRKWRLDDIWYLTHSILLIYALPRSWMGLIALLSIFYTPIILSFKSIDFNITSFSFYPSSASVV